ncbi:hypothetical protein BDW22DRAFT_1433075 [Trametopsis cervina]|nr:hypothetical protein BDW22DRAFT_1433075 [Trametopsis cervina]
MEIVASVPNALDPSLLEALHDLQTFASRPRQGICNEVADQEFATLIMASLITAHTFAGNETVQTAALAALQTLQVMLRQWFHTAWAQDMRDELIERFEYDVYADFRFDVETELVKTRQLFAAAKLSQDTFTDLEARIKLLHAELPPLSHQQQLPAENASSDITMSEVHPLPAQVYAEYPAYIRNIFTLESFTQAFSDVNMWPKAPFVQILRTAETNMCSQCIAIPTVSTCFYSAGHNACIRCALNQQQCMVNSVASYDEAAPRPKRRRIATSRGEEAMKTLALRKAHEPHQGPSQMTIPATSVLGVAHDGGAGGSNGRLQQKASDALQEFFTAPCQSVNVAHTVEDTKAAIRSRIHLLQRQLKSLDDLESKLNKYGPKALTMRKRK